MFLRHLDLTTALRPSLYDDETLLFVQDDVGLYEGKYKIANYQNGHAYLTSHRVCYVDNVEPRRYSVAVDLKEVDRTEFYPGFLKSSPKVTIFPKVTNPAVQSIRSPVPRHASSGGFMTSQPTSTSRITSHHQTRDVNATWICPICGLSNPVPANFDPTTANEYTLLSPCQACGVKPPLAVVVKAVIVASSNRQLGTPLGASPSLTEGTAATHDRDMSATSTPPGLCFRCTFQNHPSLKLCEVCGAPLQSNADRRTQLSEKEARRTGSPGPEQNASAIVGMDSIETIKLSFRSGGDKPFLERLQGALVQREWLLPSAPPIPPSTLTPPTTGGLIRPPNGSTSSTNNLPRIVGIAGLEQRGAALRQNNQAVIGTAFEDLEALKTSAKEVIQMAEQFARQTDSGMEADSDAKRIISDSASALGLVTKDMLGSGLAADQLYITELSRDLAEFLTDDRKGVLRKEGGIMSLVDLWQVFNRRRNGIELVSPLDFEKAARTWDTLQLPIRLRRFKSGLLVVQDRSRTDEKTTAAVLSWLREPQYAFPPTGVDPVAQSFGRGVTAQETAERFGWSVGVATEELEMVEETGALCRDQCLDGTRFWQNLFLEHLTSKAI